MGPVQKHFEYLDTLFFKLEHKKLRITAFFVLIPYRNQVPFNQSPYTLVPMPLN